MAIIKIKFKDGFNLSTNVDVSINFVCSGIPYQRIQVSNDLLRYQDISGDWVTCCNEIGWTNYKYKIIEIDTSQASFSTFITAMKSNIDGVLLESGTYIWNSEQPFSDGNFPTSAERKIVKFNFKSNNIEFASCGVSVYGAGEFHFAYGKSTATTTGNTYINSDVSSGKVKEVCNTENFDFWVGTEVYRTIILDADQYVDYDFYSNYVGSKLNKQITSYSITYNLTNCISDSSNPTTISDTASVIITANRGYKLPSTITVTNATYTYEESTGMIDLSNPTGDVTITVVAIQDDIIVYENQLVSIANAIRQVNSSSAKIKLDDMPSLIGTFTKPTGTKTITDTNITDVRNYANAQVSDANLTSANIVTGKTILGIAGSFSSDGTLDASKMLKGVIGYSKGVKYTGTIETYSGSYNITSNGTYSTKGMYMNNNFVVNVPAIPTQEKSVTITTNGETSVTPDTGKNLSKVTITTNIPSPTLTGNATAEDVLEGKTFYSNSTTKLTGTMQTYSGATTITSNGTISVGGMYVPNNLTVNVPATPTQEKSVTITENGTTEVTPDSGKNLSKVTVTTNVAGITEITTSSAMDAALIAANVGKYYKYVGTTDDKYTNGDIYQVQDEE